MDCPNLLHGINICKNEIRDCCVQRSEEDFGHPFIMPIDNTKSIDLDKLFLLKRKFHNEKISNPSKCKGCLYLDKNSDFSKDEDYISCINFNHWNRCNSKCIYCSEEYNGGDFYFNVLPMIKEMIEAKKFIPTGEITFQGGEPVLLPEFDELLTLFLKTGVNIRIHSSGIKYSKAIESGIKNGQVTLVVSADTGVEKTYKKIKRNPHFNDVWNNLKKYAANDSSNFVKAKMIIVPHFNDEISEIDSFVNKVKLANIKTIVIDAEAGYSNKYKYKTPNVRFLIEYMKKICDNQNICLEYYDNAKFILKNTTYSLSIPNNQQDIKKEYKKLKEKYADRKVEYS